MSFTDQLEANLVLASAGANFYSGVNNMKFPVVSGITSGWVAEYSGSDETASGALSSLTLSPKKLISTVDMSAEALTQNAGLESAIRRNMAASVASTLETALLTAGSDITSAPASIFTDAAAGATPASGNVANTDFIALESTVLGNNVPLEGARMAYIFNKDAYSDIRTMLQTAGVAAIWDVNDRRLNNYFGFFSTNVGNAGTADKAYALFGDFSKVHIAQFGGLDILFDPYTKSRQGVGSMVVTSLVDGNAVQNDKAFASLIEQS
jgi:HK97 family phage major capsid protein